MIVEHRWTYFVSPAFVMLVINALLDIDNIIQSHWIVWFCCVFLLINGIVNTIMLRWNLKVTPEGDILVFIFGRRKLDHIETVFMSSKGLILKSQTNLYFISNDTHNYNASLLISYLTGTNVLEISNFEFTAAKYTFGKYVAYLIKK